jgi:Tol biopolymer transport system component
MSLLAGAKLGPYEIAGPLGAGGMGEVYRGRDPRLRRDVAIKILPAAFSADINRLHRFEQEARASAALNHPNILAVFDIGEADGAPYVVSELLEGETFAARLQQGPLPPSKAIGLAQQVACGLAAAHEKGIVHRDLKPDNLFLCRDGRAKILDFGLAKLERSQLDAPTLTAVTDAGVVLGTVGYMSPEQVRGEAADARSDIFSFGAVLYEMLCGRRAFSAPTSAETMSAILNNDPPPLSDRSSTIPPAAERIVGHCLEKQPGERFQSARDLAFALESLSTRSSVVQPAAGVRRSWRGWPYVVAAAALVVLTVAAVRYWPHPSEKAPASVRVERLTDFVGLEEFPSLSPDGKYVAFTADISGTRQIMIRLLSGGAPLQITHDALDHQSPRWSADSGSIVYYTAPSAAEAEGTLWMVPALGGAPRRFGSSLSDADVSHDGKRIAYFTNDQDKVALKVALLDGTDAKVVRQFPVLLRHARPRWAPDDRLIAFQVGEWPSSDIYSVPAAGGEERAITTSHVSQGGFAWLPDGSGVVVSSTLGATVFYHATMNLWLAKLDGSAPRQLTFGENSYVDPDVGRDGRVVTSRLRVAYSIWKIPVNGAPADNVRSAVRIGIQTGLVQTPSVSPDDKRIVYLSDSGGHGNLWVAGADGSDPRQITFEQDPVATIGVPVWSPDGKHIIFVSTKNLSGWVDNDEWLVDPDGSNLHRLVEGGAWASWSPDGAWVYYGLNRRGSTPGGIMKIPVLGGTPVEVRSAAERAVAPAPAPDGKTLYFVVSKGAENGTQESNIHSAAPENGPSKHLVTIPGSRLPTGVPVLHPVPSPDGKWLAFPLHNVNADELWGVSTADGRLRRFTDFGSRRTFIARRVSWSSDSRFLFAAVGDGDADIVAFEGLLTH